MKQLAESQINISNKKKSLDTIHIGTSEKNFPVYFLSPVHKFSWNLGETRENGLKNLGGIGKSARKWAKLIEIRPV